MGKDMLLQHSSEAQSDQEADPDLRVRGPKPSVSWARSHCWDSNPGPGGLSAWAVSSCLPGHGHRHSCRERHPQTLPVLLRTHTAHIPWGK